MINKFLAVAGIAGTVLWGSAANATLFITTSPVYSPTPGAQIRGLMGIRTCTVLGATAGNFSIDVTVRGQNALTFPDVLLSNVLSRINLDAEERWTFSSQRRILH